MRKGNYQKKTEIKMTKKFLKAKHWQFLGKNHEFTIEKDGDYTFKGLLIASENPTLKVTTAEVVIKK
tara:strand:+ start:429 stop:629 length:201 start_codon:yes stop_codon:yes gene_type:complete